MKDYSLGEKVWILNYDLSVWNYELILHFSNGKATSIPYTLENEKKVLKTMEEQVEYAVENCLTEEEQTDYMKWEQNEIEIINLGSCVLGASVTAVGIINMIVTPEVAALVVTGIGLLSSLPHIVVKSKLLTLDNLINDLNKNHIYIASKHYFKQYDLRKRKDLVLDGTSRKTKEVLSNTQSNAEIPSININSIDKMSLKDLKRIYENLQNPAYFAVEEMDYPEEKGISYTKK